MFNKPIFFNIPEKISDFLLVIFVTIMYIMLCAEADIYVPAFPQMIKYFAIADNKIQLTLSINFTGLCIAGLVAGPLSDSYGRRKILIAGLFLFLISSIGCVLTDKFSMMIFWRLIQGLAASTPMVIGATIFFDKYAAERAGKLVGVMNSIISASMAAAPIAGAWISQIFDWRANFIVILILAIISFIGGLLFIPETLAIKDRKKFSLLSIGKDYIKLIGSTKFMCNAMLGNFSFIVIVVYIANLSVILINYMGIDLKIFSYYQATTMGSFIIFSLIAARLIGTKGLDYTKNMGSILAVIGSVLIFLTSQFDKTNINMICLSMAFIAAGGSMMACTYGTKALSVFPEMKGTAMAMANAIRQFLASSLVILSEILFDGTITPVASIIFSTAIVGFICYIIICKKEVASV